MDNLKDKKIWVYIDGFNLYFAIRNKKAKKWLDLNRLSKQLLKNAEHIDKIKFFTAKVSGKNDENKPVRQNIYWRALGTLENVEIILGRFIKKPIKIQITKDVKIEGVTMEEKGTDVNIATHLINDAHQKKFDIAFVVTNDSDLVEPIRIVNEDLKIPVGIIYPSSFISGELRDKSKAAFFKELRTTHMNSSVFPNILEDEKGKFEKPSSW